MTSIEQIFTVGGGIRLEFVNSHGEKVIGQTRINSLEGLYLNLDAPKPLDILNELSLNQNIALICKYNDDPQDYVFFTKFIKTKATDPPLMVVSKPNDYTLGRKAFRCDVNIPFGYYNNQDYKDGTVLNLSSNGLFAKVKPDDDLKIGLDLPFKLQLPSIASPVLIVGRIVRIEKLDNYYQIAINFPLIPNDIQELIGRFLSATQRSAIRKDLQKKPSFIKIQNE